MEDKWRRRRKWRRKGEKEEEGRTTRMKQKGVEVQHLKKKKNEVEKKR